MADGAKIELTEEELQELGVRCLTLSLNGMSLLLPNTMVAEVSEVLPVNVAANTPEWLSGFVSWRGRTVPAVSFEKLLGQDTAVRHGDNRMVVLNTLNGNPGIPFIAMEIQGLPHLSLLKHGMLEHAENEQRKEPVVLATVRVDGEVAIVPNVDVIERMLQNLGISA